MNGKDIEQPLYSPHRETWAKAAGFRPDDKIEALKVMNEALKRGSEVLVNLKLWSFQLNRKAMTLAN